MGRQIHFYMLPDDRDSFLRFVQENDPVVVILTSSDVAEVQPAADLDITPDKGLCLWNRKLLPHLHRKWIRDPGYYRVDQFNLPLLEFSPSFKTAWEGKPALCWGRLYGVFDGKPPEFQKWYEGLVRWIRKNYKKSPTGMGGYMGPAARDLYNHGGYLLPGFLPPRTDDWLAEIGKQHSQKEMLLRESEGKLRSPIKVRSKQKKPLTLLD